MVAIAAGTVHSVALTNDGALFCWVSSDADLRCRQVLLGSIFCLYLAHKPPRFFMQITLTHIFLCSYIRCVGELWSVFLLVNTGLLE